MLHSTGQYKQVSGKSCKLKKTVSSDKGDKFFEVHYSELCEGFYFWLWFLLQCLQLADVITSEQYQLYEVRSSFLWLSLEWNLIVDLSENCASIYEHTSVVSSRYNVNKIAGSVGHYSEE